MLVLVQFPSVGQASCIPTESRGEQDKHKAPTSTPPHPLSLQDGGDRFVVLPPLVGTIHYRVLLENGSCRPGRDKSRPYKFLPAIDVISLPEPIVFIN